MAFFIFFVLFVFPFLQAGPLDNWASFLAWAIFIVIPLIVLVQQLLQHSSAAVTQRYIGIQQQELEKAIEGHLMLEV